MPNAFTSICRCGAKLTPSTHNNAPASCTASAIERTSWIVPKIFDACVHATNLTLGERRGFRFSAVSLSPSSLDDAHHFTVSLSLSAMNNQGLTLVSCSIFVRMISSPSLNCRAPAKFIKS